MYLLRLCFLLLFVPLLLLCGCSRSSPEFKNLLKSDIDMVADAHLDRIEELLKELTTKLYRRNPRELKKGPVSSLDERVAQLFNADRSLVFPEVNNLRGVPAILFALDPDYAGDRTFALMVGMISMVRSSYNDQPEFFMLDSLDPQKLYNSARNLEILVWRLKYRLDAEGRPLLLTNSLADEARNLSFERLFGKLIAYQDVMAQIAAEKWDRAVNRVVHSAATAVFLPVGL